MNDEQHWLAELLKAGAGDPPARISVQGVRRQAAKRRGAAAAGAAAAIAVVTVVAAFSAGLPGLTGNPGPAVSPSVPAVPVPCRPGWHVAPGAAPAGDHQDWLVAVAGSASDDLWAVGDRLANPRQAFPLLEHWDGRTWAYFPGAWIGGRQAVLTSVAALASDDVWAIGHFASVGAAPSTPLIEHWNGNSWSLGPTRALARLNAALPPTLTSVAALTPGDVWVLGTPSSDSPDVYLHWNGSSWQLLHGPKFGPLFGSAAMQVIAADQRGQLWAAGGWMRGYGEAGVPGGGSIEQWNGRQWELSSSAAWKEPLTQVAPIAPDDAWAIAGGSFTTTGTYGLTPVQVLHWNGRAWKVKLSLGAANAVAVAALSADDAYVIGRRARTEQPFIDHWDGTQWRKVPLGPAARMRRQGSVGLAVTSDGSIVVLAAQGTADRANDVWLECQH